MEKSYSDLNGFGSVDHVLDPIMVCRNVDKNNVKRAIEDVFLLFEGSL